MDSTGVWFGRKLLLVRPTGESGAAGRPRVLSSGEPPLIWMLRVSAFWSSVGVLPFGFFFHCLLLVGVVWGCVSVVWSELPHGLVVVTVSVGASVP